MRHFFPLLSSSSWARCWPFFFIKSTGPCTLEVKRHMRLVYNHMIHSLPSQDCRVAPRCCIQRLYAFPKDIIETDKKHSQFCTFLVLKHSHTMCEIKSSVHISPELSASSSLRIHHTDLVCFVLLLLSHLLVYFPALRGRPLARRPPWQLAL